MGPLSCNPRLHGCQTLGDRLAVGLLLGLDLEEVVRQGYAVVFVLGSNVDQTVAVGFMLVFNIDERRLSICC